MNKICGCTGFVNWIYDYACCVNGICGCACFVNGICCCVYCVKLV